MQNNSGVLVMCGVCCVWPLVGAALGWWLRGQWQRWASGNGGKALWDIWTH